MRLDAPAGGAMQGRTRQRPTFPVSGLLGRAGFIFPRAIPHGGETKPKAHKMEKYDYEEAVCQDIRDYIEENMSGLTKQDDRDEVYDSLYDELFNADSVTGNASGSYFCNSWKAEEALCHNLDLLEEAANEFGEDVSLLQRGAEACDVTIRCYLLGQCLNRVLDEIFDKED